METNPNKAIGTDNISLKPLDTKECIWIKVDGKNYIEYNEQSNRKLTQLAWRASVIRRIAGNLETYFNHIVSIGHFPNKMNWVR